MKKLLLWALAALMLMNMAAPLAVAHAEAGEEPVESATPAEESNVGLTEDSSEEDIRAQILDMLAEEKAEDDVFADVDEVDVDHSELAVTEGLDDTWVNILLMGTDDRSSNMRGRTDSIMILSVNKETAEVKITSIMRDIWVKFYKSTSHKINAGNVFGGPNLTMRTVNEYFGMNITHYALINMQGLTNVIDAVGGLELDVTAGEQRWINSYLDEYRRFTGSNTVDQNAAGRKALTTNGPGTHLSGAQATAYCRNRYIGNDQKRTERQRTVLMALAGKLKDLGPLSLATMVPKIMESVQTNITVFEAIELGMLLVDVDLSTIQQTRIPFDGTYQSGMFGTVWCIKPDFEANAQKLKEYIYGE